jgi:hypothetical protein
MKRWMKIFASASLAAALILPVSAPAFQAPKAETKKSQPKAAATPAATDQEIADAKAKGLVWVNTESKVYHKDGRYYGKTKRGKFMTEADAQKAGFRAEKSSAVGKKKTDTKK